MTNITPPIAFRKHLQSIGFMALPNHDMNSINSAIALYLADVPSILEHYGLLDRFGAILQPPQSNRWPMFLWEVNDDGEIRQINDDEDNLDYDEGDVITILKNRALLKITQELGRELTSLIVKELHGVENGK